MFSVSIESSKRKIGFKNYAAIMLKWQMQIIQAKKYAMLLGNQGSLYIFLCTWKYAMLPSLGQVIKHVIKITGNRWSLKQHDMVLVKLKQIFDSIKHV